MHYREATPADIPAMAILRAMGWGTTEYWHTRIAGYLDRELHPRHALPTRVIYVAVDNETVVGLIAGHLTRRYDCDGEVQWIDVAPEHRQRGIASELLRHLAGWFASQHAAKVCVDVDPANTIARHFYTRSGAESLNPHWLVWNDIAIVLRRDKA